MSDITINELKQNAVTLVTGKEELLKIISENTMQDLLINYIDDNQYMIRKVPLSPMRKDLTTIDFREAKKNLEKELQKVKDKNKSCVYLECLNDIAHGRIAININFKNRNEANGYYYFLDELYMKCGDRRYGFTLLSLIVNDLKREIDELEKHEFSIEIKEQRANLNYVIELVYKEMYDTLMESYLNLYKYRDMITRLGMEFMENEKRLLALYHPQYYMIHNAMSIVLTCSTELEDWYYAELNPEHELSGLIKSYREYYHLNDEKNKEEIE